MNTTNNSNAKPRNINLSNDNDDYNLLSGRGAGVMITDSNGVIISRIKHVPNGTAGTTVSLLDIPLRGRGEVVITDSNGVIIQRTTRVPIVGTGTAVSASGSNITPSSKKHDATKPSQLLVNKNNVTTKLVHQNITTKKSTVGSNPTNITPIPASVSTIGGAFPKTKTTKTTSTAIKSTSAATKGIPKNNTDIPPFPLGVASSSHSSTKTKTMKTSSVPKSNIPVTRTDITAPHQSRTVNQPTPSNSSVAAATTAAVAAVPSTSTNNTTANSNNSKSTTVAKAILSAIAVNNDSKKTETQKVSSKSAAPPKVICQSKLPVARTQQSTVVKNAQSQRHEVINNGNTISSMEATANESNTTWYREVDVTDISEYNPDNFLTGTHFLAYTKTVASYLEKFYQLYCEGKGNPMIYIRFDKKIMYIFDFHSMVQTNVDTKEQCKMRRNTEQHIVRKGCAEYESIESYFYRTIGKHRSLVSIVKIERIHNQALFDQYIGKLKTMKKRDKENPHHRINNHNKHCMQKTLDGVPSLPEPDIERHWLFHGTSAGAIPKIIMQGFNRSFARQDAVKYGRGVYFARDAYYSCDERYAVPDQDGVQHVFLCRVAVGDWCLGTNNQITPDCKPHDDREVFDSTVDNTQDPNIFVIYHDCQAYPEYLLSFRTTTIGC